MLPAKSRSFRLYTVNIKLVKNLQIINSSNEWLLYFKCAPTKSL